MPVCAACGKAAPDEARFCSACGGRLAVQTPPAGESRRRVTVVFSDLAGSTQLGEQLDPESLRRVMGRYYAEMRAEIERHGGSLEKFIGDAVMAVFGVPVRREDDALRAVRAAAAMREAQERLNAELERRYGVRLRVRTGVNTGEVVAGDPGIGEAFVIGDAVNVAARLEQAAAPGEILIGAETEYLVRAAAAREPVEPLALKGKSERVAAFRLLGLHEADEQAGAEPPLVGRRDELAALHAAFERCIARRGCELVTVIGAPGIGKSRLVRELESRLGQRARFLRGRCLSYGEGGTFWPVAEVVRGAAGIGLDESPELARTKLAALLPDDGSEATVAGLVGATIGLDDVPHQPEEAFWAIRRLLEALAGERPQVVLLDDLQWGEAGLHDLVGHLGSARLDAAVLLLCLARPELREARPDGWGALLALEPLPEEDSRRLVGSLVGGVEPAVAARISEAARGNPLFVGELVRSLVEDGSLEHRDGRLTAVVPLDELTVPPTLEALLAARLERLGAGERAVAECASVVGEDFGRDEVAVLAPEAVRDALDRSLAALVRHEVIVATGDGAFRFAHLLTRDVTYQGMLKERRAELHERFADWLEAHAGDRVGEVEDIVAHHLEQAYRYRASLAAVGERELRLAHRAHTHLVSAGQRALSRLDRPGAIKLLRAAAELLPSDDPAVLDVRLEIANALAEHGDGVGAQAEAAAVLRTAEAAGRDGLALRARVEDEMHRLWSEPGSGAPDVGALAEQAIARFEQLGDRRGLARAWRLRAMRELMLLRFDAAAEGFAVAIDHARAAGDVGTERELFSWQMATELVWGTLPAGEAERRALELLETRRGRPYDELYARMTLMSMYFLQQRADEARALWRELAALVAELGLVVEASTLDFIGGGGEQLSGNPQAAREPLRRAFEAADEGSRWTMGVMYADVLLELGEREQARELCDRAVAEAIPTDVQVQVARRAVKAKLLAGDGRIDEAERLAREAVLLSEPTDELNERARAWTALATVHAAAARRDEADAAFREAVALYERKENAAGAARVRELRESLLAPAGGR